MNNDGLRLVSINDAIFVTGISSANVVIVIYGKTTTTTTTMERRTMGTK